MHRPHKFSLTGGGGRLVRACSSFTDVDCRPRINGKAELQPHLTCSLFALSLRLSGRMLIDPYALSYLSADPFPTFEGRPRGLIMLFSVIPMQGEIRCSLWWQRVLLLCAFFARNQKSKIRWLNEFKELGIVEEVERPLRHARVVKSSRKVVIKS
jgi:hypothetical protein